MAPIQRRKPISGGSHELRGWLLRGAGFNRRQSRCLGAVQRGTTWNNVGRLGAAIHWVNLGWGIVQIAERFKG